MDRFDLTWFDFDGITNATRVLANNLNWIATYDRIVNETSIAYYTSKKSLENISYDFFQLLIWQAYNYILVFVKLLIENVIPIMFRFGDMLRRTKYKSHMMSGTLLLFLIPFIIIYLLSSRKRKENALIQCFQEMVVLISSKDCHPILLRLAWSDAATYDQSIKLWPNCGGTTGSIRFDKEISHPSNAGLSKALQYLRPLHKKYHNYISWADLIQMGGALAVELSGGPSLQSKMIYGRKDAPVPKKQQHVKQLSNAYNSSNNNTINNGTSSEVDKKNSKGTLLNNKLSMNNRNANNNNSNNNNNINNNNNNSFLQVVNATISNPNTLMQSLNTTTNMNTNSNNSTTVKTQCESSRLPVPEPPYPYSVPTAEAHIRHTFYRMGFKNKEIVALCGAHTIGRGFKDRTGVCAYASGDMNATMYTRQNWIAKAGGRPGIGMAGGCSWTKNWLQFDNSYFQRIHTLINNSNSNNNNNSHNHRDNHNNHNHSIGKINTGKNTKQLNSDHDSNTTSNTIQQKEGELLWLSTDWALYNCSEFRPHFLRYANDQPLFFEDYADAHKKMSELGAKFENPTEGIRLPYIDITKYTNN